MHVLVALDHLVAKRQRIRIDGEVAIHVGEPLGLEPYVALLRIRSQRGGMAERNHIVAARIGQSHPRGDRPARSFGRSILPATALPAAPPDASLHPADSQTARACGHGENASGPTSDMR